MRDAKKTARIASIATAAEEAFWATVAKLVPEAKTGDLDPHSTILFRTACLDVIAEWMEANAPAPTVMTTSTAACELVVSMRPPRKGERMYMVEARNADDALAEVLRSSEELGYPAPHDHDDRPDEYGMVAVTITFRKPEPFFTPESNYHAEEEDKDKDEDENEDDSPTREARRRAIVNEIRNRPDYNGWCLDVFSMEGNSVGFVHKDATVTIMCSPDFHKIGKLSIEPQDDHGNVLDTEGECADLDFDTMTGTADQFFALVKPWLDRHQPTAESIETALVRELVESQQAATLVEAAKPMALTSLTLANYQVGAIVDAILATEVLHEDAHTGEPSPIDLTDWIKNGDTILRDPALKPIADYYLAMTGRMAKEAK